MECKLFTTPRFHDEEFYAEREVADHINQPGHRERLTEALELIVDICADGDISSIVDWGAGNGGLLHELRKQIPEKDGIEMWGYDLSPKAVQYGIDKYKVDLRFLDIENGVPADVGDIVILTEVLEHVIDPHSMLTLIRLSKAKWIVASSPAGETPQRHYEFHNWCWMGDSYAKMFERCGWQVMRHYALPSCGTQFVVAKNPTSLPGAYQK